MLALIPLAVGAQPDSGSQTVYPNKQVRMRVGFAPGSSSPAELAAIIEADIGKRARVIKEGGITASD